MKQEKDMKKYIAPIIFGCLAMVFIIAGGLFYFVIFKQIPGIGFIGILVLLVSIGLAVAMIVVLIIRLKEIKMEDEDDFGKY